MGVYTLPGSTTDLLTIHQTNNTHSFIHSIIHSFIQFRHNLFHSFNYSFIHFNSYMIILSVTKCTHFVHYINVQIYLPNSFHSWLAIISHHCHSSSSHPIFGCLLACFQYYWCAVVGGGGEDEFFFSVSCQLQLQSCCRWGGWRGTY